jgi:hypothetical protein
MVNAEIVQMLILLGMGMIVAIILIFFGFAMGRKTLGETYLPVSSLFKPDQEPPEEDVFEKALLSPEEGGYSDEELDEMARARPYEGMQ